MWKSSHSTQVSIKDWLWESVILAFLSLAVLIFIAGIFLAVNWLKTPFIGGLVDQNLYFSNIGPIVTGTWSAINRGVRPGDQLLEINGKPVLSSSQMQNIIKDFKPGQAVSLLVRRNEQTVEMQIDLAFMPWADLIGYLVVPYFVGLAFLASGWWIFLSRRSSSNGKVYAVFVTAAALSTGSIFNLVTTHELIFLWVASIPLVGGAIIHLALILFDEGRPALRFRWLPYLGYIAAAILLVYTFIRSGDASSPAGYLGAWKTELVFTGLAVLFFLGWISYRRYNSKSPLIREPARTILVGGIFAFVPLAIWFLMAVFHQETSFFPYILLPLAVFPLTSGYCIYHGRLLQTDYILSRVALYGLLTILVAGAYALLVSLLNIGLVNMVSPGNPLLVGGVTFLLALLIAPARDRLRLVIDRVFFRGERTYQERIQTFKLDLVYAKNSDEIVRFLRHYINTALMPAQLHIFIYDPFSERYNASPGDSGRTTTDLRFSVDSALIRWLGSHQLPLFIDRVDSIPSSLQTDSPRLVILAAQLYVALPGKELLAGWIALGSRQSGELYTTQDLRYLEFLCEQAALAIERAQILANMETQVHQLAVLARVAQGVNVTISFDDVLELIYAQTSQVIPTRDFLLTILDNKSNSFQQAFCLEDDERLNERENKPLSAGEGLEIEVIRSRRSIITDDYQRECQKRGIHSTMNRIYSWMSVPLNAGAETIGALSIGSRNPDIVYTQEQLNFLQAIADQTAGAIVKTRLLQETEHRARQLATLNEVTRQLTSTLELEPLLQNILQNAVDILNCEAGSLILIDDVTGELVFQAAAGPVAEYLIGNRLPSGTGFVGKAIMSRQPLIVNDVQQNPGWFSYTDNQTGFQTQAILVSLLQVKDDIMGGIEVANRLDGQPFSDDDLTLLTAFASQAAVAIENARLYTQTDQALSARVEELSVMQRIDRELNTSLDPTLAMRITLEWAMRQSGSTAGLVAILQQEGLKIMAYQGYTDELKPFKDKPFSSGFIAIEIAIETGQPQVTIIEHGLEAQALLDGARSQIVIPIRRETRVIGILLLESIQPDTGSEDVLGFLSRLSDHASIAISNAQLYSAIQDANNAKSEFVSFVAHELKNPMTSIKGYTELLAAGAVGAVTPAQSNFLSTIRSNIERMNTLVSDLNDISKIEAGRLRLEFKPISLKDVVDDTLRSTRRQIDEKRQELNLSLPQDLPMVWADRTRVTQILVNLVNNANKYTSQGGQIIIAGEVCPNQWDPDGPPQVVHVWVKDTGIGISPEDQKKIFQKFFRSEDPKTREVPGTGLGLNITRSLVEMQGGHIWFESQFRVGTIFHFTVPVAE